MGILRAGALLVIAIAGAQVAAVDGPTRNAGRNWDIAPAPIPALIYEQEAVALTIAVANRGRTTRECRLIFALDGELPQAWRLSLAAGKETVAVFSLRVAVPDAPRRGTLYAVETTEPPDRPADAARPFWQFHFTLRDGRGDLSDLCAAGTVLVDPAGESVALVNRRENEAEYRRWAPVKYAVAAWRRHGAPRRLSAPASLVAAAAAADAASLALPGGRTLVLIPHAGDPLAALPPMDDLLPADGPAVLALAWGFREAYDRYPLREFARALDLAIDRARAKNPQVQIALVTPPPIPGEAESVGRYAEEIRRLAREHHAELIDWHDAVLAHPDWERFFALPGGDGVTGLYPNESGAGFLRERLAEALW